MTTIYRNYIVARVGDKFVARSTDDECLLVASNQQRLHSAIDDLWDSLEKGREPAWFTGSTAIDLDTFGPAFGPESAPSTTDPPVKARAGEWKISYPTFGLTAAAVSAPLSYCVETMFWPRQVDVMLTIGVCAVAVAFGKRFALMSTFIASIVYNFTGMVPLLEFSWPTFSEFGFLLMNLAASFGIPELIRMRCFQSRLERRRTPHT